MDAPAQTGAQGTTNADLETVPQESLDVDTADHGEAEAGHSTPQDAEVFMGQGRDYLARDEYQRAAEAFSEAIKLDPQDPNAHYNKGLATMRLGQYTRAVEDFDEAIRLDPQDVDAYVNRGISYLMMAVPSRLSKATTKHWLWTPITPCSTTAGVPLTSIWATSGGP